MRNPNPGLNVRKHSILVLICSGLKEAITIVLKLTKSQNFFHHKVNIFSNNFLLVFNSLLWLSTRRINVSFDVESYLYFRFQFRIKIWHKYNKLMIDSGEIKDPDIRGGKLGVMSFSQEKCMWSAVSTRCLGKWVLYTFLCCVVGRVFATLQRNLGPFLDNIFHGI